jgi:hypothetical protein
MMTPRALTPDQEDALKGIQKEYTEGLAEAAADSGMAEGEIYGDIAESYALEMDDVDVAWEFLRRELGYVPSGLGRRL